MCALADGKKFDIYEFMSDGAVRAATKAPKAPAPTRIVAKGKQARNK